MNSDVADAIPRLVEAGVLPPDEAPRLLRVARGELLSLHWELRALLYVGVLLVTGGVGLLVKENLDRIGPVVIVAGIGLAAAAALGWVIRVAPPFSWREVPSPNLAFDYILLLGVLLAAASLGRSLILDNLASWMGAKVWWSWTVALLLAGLGLATRAFLARRFPLLAFGVVAAYAALSRLALEGVNEWGLGCFWFFLTPIPVIVGLIFAQRRLKEPE